MHFHWQAVGVIGALVSLPIHLFLPHDVSVNVAGFTLGCIAAIYLGFALADGRMKIILLESVVAFAFIAAALAGMYWVAWCIPIAVAAHGIWDYAHHTVTTAMPRWYIPFCAWFDWAFAAGLTVLWLNA